MHFLKRHLSLLLMSKNGSYTAKQKVFHQTSSITLFSKRMGWRHSLCFCTPVVFSLRNRLQFSTSFFICLLSMCLFTQVISNIPRELFRMLSLWRLWTNFCRYFLLWLQFLSVVVVYLSVNSVFGLWKKDVGKNANSRRTFSTSALITAPAYNDFKNLNETKQEINADDRYHTQSSSNK